MGAVFRQFCDLSDTCHLRIVESIAAMKETNMIFALHRYAHRIPTADAEKLVAASFKFCQINTGLIRHYHSKSMFVFHYTLKHHYLLHVALEKIT